MRIEAAPGHEVHQAVNTFYASNGSNAKARPDDLFFLAMEGDSVIGCVRYCVENEVPMLRTMRVTQAWQRQGVGLALLTRFVGYIDEHRIRDVFCLPYSHLDRFYGLRGFMTLPIDQAPVFLQERLQIYDPTGALYICMKRP
jgi:N-acetylglutamate synthase-like GNAT family acetyltransferase